jgi:hypothetical protein
MKQPFRCNLLLVARRAERHVRTDLQKVAEYCRGIAPDIRVFVLTDNPLSLLRLDLAARPTLVFAPRRLLFYHPVRGTVRSGLLLPKSEEYRRLEAAGLPVPRWRLMTARHSPEVADLGHYVVTKPDYGGRGADIRIQRASRVRWRPPRTPVRLAGRSPVIAQKFIYTGRWPVSYRVSTLFGRVLFSWRAEASHDRRPLASPEGFDDGGGMSIVSSHRGCSFTLNEDPEIIALGERSHCAFREIGFLGVDILREEPSGRLFVIEVNSSGDMWHFSSSTGKSIQSWAGISFAAQRGGLRRVTEILIDEARRQAR